MYMYINKRETHHVRRHTRPHREIMIVMSDCSKVLSMMFGTKEGMRFSFATSYDLILANMYFKKRDAHLVAYKSKLNFTQIDFILIWRVERVFFEDCTVIPGKILITQHKLMMLDMSIKNNKTRNKLVESLNLK